jgi:septum formation topological specificity factor MinE
MSKELMKILVWLSEPDATLIALLNGMQALLGCPLKTFLTLAKGSWIGGEMLKRVVVLWNQWQGKHSAAENLPRVFKCRTFSDLESLLELLCKDEEVELSPEKLKEIDREIRTILSKFMTLSKNEVAVLFNNAKIGKYEEAFYKETQMNLMVWQERLLKALALAYESKDDGKELI